MEIKKSRQQKKNFDKKSYHYDKVSQMLEKTCTKCNTTYDLDGFYTLKDGRYGRQAICKTCFNKRAKEWRIKSGYQKKKNARQKKEYWQDPNKAKLPNLKCRHKHREFLYIYCMGKSCIDCGTGDIRVLEFDHVRGQKIFDVGKTVGRKLEDLKEEIRKCDLRCRNCHWIRTLRERNAYKYNRYLFEIDNGLLPNINNNPYYDERNSEEKLNTQKPKEIFSEEEKSIDKRLIKNRAK